MDQHTCFDGKTRPIPTHGFQLSSPCTSLGCADHRVSWTSLQSQTSAFLLLLRFGGGVLFFCHRKMMSKSTGKPVKNRMPNYHINWELIYLHTSFFWWDTKPQTNALISTQKIHSKITIDDPLFFTAFEFERGAEITSAPLGFITLSSPRIFWCQACEAAAKACLKPQGNVAQWVIMGWS